MVIDFEEKDHCYSLNGEIADISVTELLHKHNLAPDYSGAPKKKLTASAKEGKEVHKDLENVLNVADYEPTTKQGKSFQEWVSKHLDCGVGEQMLGIDWNGLLVCGTADVMAIGKDNSLIVADHKNIAKVDATYKEYVSWQVSLLDFMARKLGKEPINGKVLNWKGAKEFWCLHYNKKTGELTPIELEKVEDTEIENLLDCERKGEIYQRPMLVIDKELELQFLQAEEELSKIELAHKQAEEKSKALRQQLCELFEKQGIYSWESPQGKIKVTYIRPSEQIRVDSDKLKEKYPQVYTECQKLIKKKGYVLVTLREDEE